jgi:dTMP kinase
LEWLDVLEYKVFKLPRPDLVIYLELPLKLSLKLKQDYYKKYPSKDTLENNKDYYRNSAKAAQELSEREKWKKVSCADTCDGGGKKILPKEVIHDFVYNLVRGAV